MIRLLSIIAAVCLATTAYAGTSAKTPEQTCQAQALTSIAKAWPNVMSGNFEIILKANRCLVFLQAPAIYEGKRGAWLIDGKTGDLLSEFYGPENRDRGLCSYRDGKFPTKNDCTWSEYIDKANHAATNSANRPRLVHSGLAYSSRVSNRRSNNSARASSSDGQTKSRVLPLLPVLLSPVSFHTVPD